MKYSPSTQIVRNMCRPIFFVQFFSLFFAALAPQTNGHLKYVCSTFIVLYSRHDLINIARASKTFYFCEQNNRDRIQFRSKRRKTARFCESSDNSNDRIHFVDCAVVLEENIFLQDGKN